jgi:hypothetical protein
MPPSWSIHPDEQQLVEDALQEHVVGRAGRGGIDGEPTQRRPRVDRRIDVAERPLVRRQLAVGCMYHSRRISSSWSLANPASTWAIATH